jgi:hypothetical protein
MRFKFLALVGIMLTLLVSLAPASAQDSYAYVRVANYVSDGPAVDVYLNGALSDVRSILFGDVSAWVGVPAGEVSFGVTPTGGDINDSYFNPKTATLAPGSWTTVFVAGSTFQSKVAASVVTENYSDIPADMARVTVFHGILGAVPVNFVAGGEVRVDTLAFPGAAGNNDGATTLDLPAGNYADLQILRADTGAKLLELPTSALEGGKYYLIAAVGLPETRIAMDFEISDPAAVVAGIEEQMAAVAEEAPVPETGFLRAAHFFPNGPAIDIYVDGAISEVANVSYGSASDWVQIPTGAHQIAIVPNGGNLSDALQTQTLSIAPGIFTTVYVTVKNAAPNIEVILEDYSNIPAGKARATFIHAADGAVPVNVYLGDGVLLLQALAYPGNIGDNDGSATVDIIPAVYDIRVTTGVETELLEDMPDTEFEDGIYYLIAVYRASDNTITTIVLPTDVNALLEEAG